MDILKQGALIYQRMCKHTHVFLLENGKEIRVVCKPSNFAHLAGLRKFSDVPEFWRESSANYIFKRILSDDITILDAQRSYYYDFSAKERIESLVYFEEVLNTDRVVYNFNPAISHSRIKSDILFFKLDNGAYLILGTANNGGTYYPETFFLCFDDLYIRGQEIIKIIEYKKEIFK